MSQTVRSRTTIRHRESVSPFHLTRVVSGFTALRDPFFGPAKTASQADKSWQGRRHFRRPVIRSLNSQLRRTLLQSQESQLGDSLTTQRTSDAIW